MIILKEETVNHNEETYVIRMWKQDESKTRIYCSAEPGPEIPFALRIEQFATNRQKAEQLFLKVKEYATQELKWREDQLNRRLNERDH
jgi:hypothetical protein